MPDPSILHCPRQQNPYPGRVASENWFDDDSYTYLGYIITNDEELEAFVNVYKVRIAQGLPFNCDLDAPPGLGSSHSDKFVRLQKDINRYITPLIGFPGGGSNSNVESLPIMWDNLQLKPCENTPSSNHSPIGSNVLFYDGHVAFLKYPGNFPVSEKSIILLSELRALRVSP